MLALSALYSVLTTSEQLLSDEYNSHYQIPEGALHLHEEAFQNHDGSELPFFGLADYDQDGEDRHSPLTPGDLSLIELTEAVEQNSNLSLSDLLEILNDSMGSGVMETDVKFYDGEGDLAA